MADKQDGAAKVTEPASAPTAEAKPKVPPKPQNPVFKMMGLPRFKLPSRNWLIFWTIVGSWSGAVYYDRREKKRITKRYCEAVKHLAREPLPPSQQQRKLTIFLSAPPSDGLMVAREHFHEYVRPILQSAGLDWDAIEGRREGDVRANFAEWIRKRRKMAGEPSQQSVEGTDEEVIIESVRQRMGVKDWSGPAGDVVIGRNTWKEYVRGLHEGWLGPIDTPEQVKRILNPPPEPETPAEPGSTPAETASDTPSSEAPPDSQKSNSEGNVVFDSEEGKVNDEPKKAEEMPKDDAKPAKPKQPPPFISTSAYSSASLPPSIPPELGPSAVITFPTLYGFLNTPTRIYRYLNKRKLAEETGREAVAVCFAAYRPYEQITGSIASRSAGVDSASPTSAIHQDDLSTRPSNQDTWEQDTLSKKEESEWHKSVRKERDPEKESVWLDDMVLDPRIAARMRKFYLDEADVAKGLALAEAETTREDASEE